MYKKELYKAALISSPIIAMYGVAPAFSVRSIGLVEFFGAVLLFTIAMLFLWAINIYVIRLTERKGFVWKWNRYFLSYLFSIVLATILVLFLFLSPNDVKEKPPYFYPMMTVVAANTIILIISNLVVVQYKKAQSDNELAMLKIKNMEAEHQQLIQQLQPHFLFNSLSTLKSLIKSDVDLAEDYLIKLADFLRVTISSHKSKLVLLFDELQFTQDYIGLQQIRFTNSFFCKIDIPVEKLSEYCIPVYALQTLVENAIKHNAFTEQEPLNLVIEYRDNSIVVTNNKIPKVSFGKSGIGLSNLNERYLLATGKEIDIADKKDSFYVTIHLIKNLGQC